MDPDSSPELPARRRKFTVAEVEQMVDAGILSEDDRLELIDGELLLMPPQKPPHAAATARIDCLLEAAYGPSFHARQHCPIDASPHSLPEPDVALVRGAPEDYRAAHPTAANTIVVVEVVRTTLADARRKIRIYARAGFSTYWLVDLERLVVEVYESPRADGEYGAFRVLARGDVVALPGLGRALAVSQLLLID